MDIERILQTRANRTTRNGRPFNVFYASMSRCLDAGKSLLADPAIKHAKLLERSVVITMVSAIEVYYKDVLDSIFRVCSPDFFEPHLKRIHATKYDITDVLAIYRNQVHPLELITANQSFQSAETIEAVFSKFLGNGLWGAVIGLQVRLKDDPETECTFEPELLADLKSLFALRHELVHNPAQRTVYSREIHNQIIAAGYLVFGSDVALTDMMAKNQDPSLGHDEKQHSASV